MQVRQHHHVDIGVATQVSGMRHPPQEGGGTPKHWVSDEPHPLHFEQHR